MATWPAMKARRAGMTLLLHMLHGILESALKLQVYISSLHGGFFVGLIGNFHFSQCHVTLLGELDKKKIFLQS